MPMSTVAAPPGTAEPGPKGPAARPDLDAFNHAFRLGFDVAVKELVEALGVKLVAYLAGAKDTRTVRGWADGERDLRRGAAGTVGEVEPRLRLALQVARMIAEHDDTGVAQAWFQGLNPQLDDRSPARLLRDGDLGEVGPRVLDAARAFVVGG